MELNFLSSITDKLAKSTYSIYGIDEKGDRKIYLEFDSILECSYNGSSTVTQYPAESGINVTDYKYSNPDQITLKGIISKNGTVGLGALNINYSIFGQDKVSLIETTRQQLNELCRQMKRVNIQTRNSGLRTSFTLSGFEITETPDNYNLLEADMTFDEVLLFGTDGKLNRSASDEDTQDGGIVQTLATDIKAWWNS